MTSAWLRVVAPLAGLIFIVLVTQAALPVLASSPEDGSFIGAMVVLAIAYAINLGILVHALRRRRDGGQDELVAAVGGEPPQTPA